MNNLSYRATNKYIYFFWQGDYCGGFDIPSNELSMIWKSEEVVNAVNSKLKELGYEDIK